MSQFAQDQQIAAILGSGRPSPMRGINQSLAEGGGPQLATTTSDQNSATPQINMPSFQAPQPSIAQSSVPPSSPIAQAAVPQQTAYQKQMQASEKARLAANIGALQNMGNASTGQGGYIGANGNFGNAVSGAVI